MPQGMSGSRLQAQWALGHALWHEAWAHGLTGLRPCLVQGVGVMDHTIGLGSKAQRDWGLHTIQVF